MNFPEYAYDIINYASDITAGLFLLILILSIAFQIEKNQRSGHLLAASFMVLGGILFRMLARTLELIPDGFEQDPAFITPGTDRSLWILSFLFMTIGITEAITNTIYMYEGGDKKGLRDRYIACAIIFAAGAILFGYTGNFKALSAALLAQFVYAFLYLHRHGYKHAADELRRASLFAIVTFVITLVVGRFRMTGIGLAVMLMIMNEQSHYYLAHELAENEAELAKRKIQLLAEQISPHYIYNSLQSIRDLCDTDPAAARDAIDHFSEYLRGNLESLTVEELIPFARELELTEAYLDLEKLTGREQFEVGYMLETTDFMLPPLVLQPVVENAVKHGAFLAASKGAGATKITIATRDLGDCICIEVTDSTEMAGGATAAGEIGAGAPEKMPKTAKNSNKKKKSVGLENVRTRLALQSGGSLDLESTCSGTKVTMILPVPLQDKS